MTLPSFLVIGAPKAGTTALYHYLRQHPEVFMSPLKEPNYFAFAGHRPRFGGPRAEILERDVVSDRAAYEALFRAGAGKVALGEASPRYMSVSGTARRIRDVVPGMRLVAILRNPIERAHSSFAMYQRDGFEPADTLEQAIDDEPRRLQENWAFAVHVQKGFYYTQLMEYYETFPSEQIRIYTYDDFQTDHAKVMRDLFEFIGVDREFSPDASVKHNVSGMIRSPFLRFLWAGTHRWRSAAPLLPKAVRRRASAFFTSRAMVRAELPEATRRRLRAIYHDDVLRLQDLIGRDCSAWLR